MKRKSLGKKWTAFLLAVCMIAGECSVGYASAGETVIVEEYDAAGSDLLSDGNSGEGSSASEGTAAGSASQEMEVGSTVTEETNGEGTVTDETTTGDTETNGTSSEGAVTNGTTTEDTATNGTSTDGTVTNGTTTEDTTTNGTSTDGTVTDETTTGDTETNGTTTEGAATNGTTTEDTATNGTTTDGTATNGTTTGGNGSGDSEELSSGENASDGTDEALLTEDVLTADVLTVEALSADLLVMQSLADAPAGSLQYQINNAANNTETEITLDKNYEENIVIPDGKSIILNLGEYTLSPVREDGSTELFTAVTVYGTLTVRGGAKW